MSVLFTRRGTTSSSPSLVVDDVFSANSWEKIIEACQMNQVPDAWVVGDSKPILLDGVEYQIDIIGKNHDIYSDGTGIAPLTFQMHDCHTKKHSINTTDTNRDGWVNSRIRTKIVPEFILLMPSEIQSALHKVNKLTSAGGTSNAIMTTADELFLLSEVETHGTTVQSKPGEGKQYEYYRKGNSAVKKASGTNTTHWLRSPVYSNSGNYCCINTGGDVRVTTPTSANGVAFAFCF